MKDYRRRLLKTIPVYYYPSNEQSEHALWHALQRFADDHPLLTTKPIELYGREIVVKQRTETVIWFDFAAICGRPRSQQDYLALAKLYKVILVSNLPHLIKVSVDQVVSFINLVDILYEAHIPLILSAAVSIEQLYPQGAFRNIFQRTESRLIEMQTEEWILNI